MKNAKKWFWIGFWGLVIIFGVDAALGNLIFNDLWAILVVIVDGLGRLAGAVLTKLSTYHFH